jgi:1-acyl-sn-glycerol-3-phosphate acyltransferase
MMHLFLRAAAPRYAAWIARRNLDGVFWRGEDQLREALAAGPVLLATNHLGWWDGQLVLLLMRRLGLEPGVDAGFLIEAKSVQEMSYLRHIGAIPIDRSSVTGALSGIEAAAAFLDRPGKLIWIFPQGRYRPSSVRPLGLERGALLLARMTGATLVPGGVVTGWRLNHAPSLVLTLGEPVRGRHDQAARLEAAICAEIDRADGWIDAPGSVPDMAEMVPTGITPFQDRLGSRFYLAFARALAAVRRALGR